MKNSATVYSTEFGKICAGCNRPVNDCICNRKSEKSKKQGTIKILTERKGRKGKTVTLLSGFQMTTNELKELARELKQQCGSGGSVKDDNILIQGDHRDILIKELEKRGFTCKKSGG